MKHSSGDCPICGEGPLRVEVSTNVVEYKNQVTELPLHYAVCDACGSEQSNSSQLRANRRAMLAFKKQVDGLLSGAEVRAIRKKLGISQAEAARIFGGGPVAFSKYETDDVVQSEAMDKLLRLVSEFPQALGYMKYRAGVDGANSENWTSIPMPLSHERRHVLKVVFSSRPECKQEWKKCA